MEVAWYNTGVGLRVVPGLQLEQQSCTKLPASYPLSLLVPFDHPTVVFLGAM